MPSAFSVSTAALKSAEEWLSLCVAGTCHGFAVIILDTRDEAIKLDEEIGLYYNTRGIVCLRGTLEPAEILKYLSKRQRSTRMSEDLMRQFRNRWQAVAAVEAQEQQSASITLRWQQMNAIFRLAFGLKLPTKEIDREEEVVRERWARLKGLQV